MPEKLLITGASGLIGSRLSNQLVSKGFAINILGRNAGASTVNSKLKHFEWDIEKGILDPEAFVGVSAIIHLAGAGVAEKRWTDARKQEIVHSRVKSAELIYKFLKAGKHTVATFVSASAVGYYGDCSEEILAESHSAGNDFLANVCKQWEQGAINIGSLGIREVRCRIGIVLAKDGGALPELTRSLPVGVASYFAKHDLYYPWVHIDDVCGIMHQAIINPGMKGAYNTTAPRPLLMKELMQHILKVKKSHALLMPAPPLALKIALGEMSSMLLGSQRCSADKIINAGYRFAYPDIDKALKTVL